jgi:hypothetical protein
LDAHGTPLYNQSGEVESRVIGHLSEASQPVNGESSELGKPCSKRMDDAVFGPASR